MTEAPAYADTSYEGGDELVSVCDEPDGFGGDFIGGALVTFPANSVEQTTVLITFVDRTVEDFRDFVLLFVIDDDWRRGILDAVWDRVRVVGLE